MKIGQILLLITGFAAVLAADQPNIVLILADDLGYGDLRLYNPESKIPTPNLDRLASQGIRLTDAHTPDTVCTPTRYGVLTGRYSWRTRLKRGVLKGTSPPLIAKDRLTLPGLLKERGYLTGAVGKWHLGAQWTLKDDAKPVEHANIDWSKPLVDGPLQHGFSYYFGLGKPAWTFIDDDYVLVEPTEQFDISHLPGYLMGANNTRGWRGPGYKHERMLPRFTEEAVGFIDRSAGQGKPFFLYFTPMTPHRPVVPNQASLDKSQAGLYGDFVYELDWATGELMKALERNGVAEDTLIMLTSDNGPEIDAYRRILEYRHFSMGPWRGVKRDLWEGGHHVPFIARWPGRIPAGKTHDEVICLTDLMATVAEIVDYDLPSNAAEDSYSVLPVLLGKKLEQPIREATVHHSSSNRYAIRQGDWVLIDHQTGDENRGKEPDWFRRERMIESHTQPTELFHLAEDHAQTKNLVAEFPERAKALKALLEKYKRDGRSVRR